MDLKKAHQYAEVVIKKACNFQPGQTLYLEAQVEVEDFICIMAEEAYKAGASEVGVQWISNKLDRVHMQNGQVKPLAGPHLAEVEYFAKKNAVRIRVESPDLNVFDDVDADMIQKKAFVHRQARIRYEQLADEVFGCIICVPSPSWAKAVYPEMPEEEALETLWETVFTCVRVNTPDPMKAWDEFIANTRKRIEILNTKNYRQYHYFSPVTDLYMSTIQPQVWGGACEDLKTVEGYNIINVPTEEVFACPHKYKVNGYITSTLPLVYDGKLIV
ncbi:MAG: aminopeptidase, partial [Erysipelotrichaceae bacterium]|nr:aminopeptidase [Erysipelotrichaceae bacterium]